MVEEVGQNKIIGLAYLILKKTSNEAIQELIAMSFLKKHTYFPSGSVSSVHSFKVLPLYFQGNLHSALLSGLSLVVRHI